MRSIRVFRFPCRCRTWLPSMYLARPAAPLNGGLLVGTVHFRTQSPKKSFGCESCGKADATTCTSWEWILERGFNPASPRAPLLMLCACVPRTLRRCPWTQKRPSGFPDGLSPDEAGCNEGGQQRWNIYSGRQPRYGVDDSSMIGA